MTGAGDYLIGTVYFVLVPGEKVPLTSTMIQTVGEGSTQSGERAGGVDLIAYD